MLSKVHTLPTMLAILGIPIMRLARSHAHRVQWSLTFLSLAWVSLRLLSLAQASLSLAQASLRLLSLAQVSRRLISQAQEYPIHHMSSQ